MGYVSYLHGRIEIDPPITWKDLQGSLFVRTPERREYERLVWLDVAEETVETDEGSLIRKHAAAIRVSDGDELRADGLVAEVQEILNVHGEGRTFGGHILVHGECSPDIWRVEVQDGKAVEVRPQIVWPDGTTWAAEAEAGL